MRTAGPKRGGLSARLALILTILVPAFAGAGSTSRITDGVGGTWFREASSTSGGKIFWIDAAGAVRFFDGNTISVVQPSVPSEGNVDTVFAVGTGATAGSVIAAWRRGTDFAHLSVNGGAPVAINTLANPYQPTFRMNAENRPAIADGCVFFRFQVPTGTTLPKHIFRIDTATGAPTMLTPSSDTAADASGPATSGCKAAWRYDPNTGVAGDSVLHYWNGTSRSTIDSGDSIGNLVLFARGRILYTKDVGGVEQVFLYDTNAVSPVPVPLTSYSDPGRSIVHHASDGRQLAWVMAADAFPDDTEIVFYGGMPFSEVGTRPTNPGTFKDALIQLQRGQLLWRNDNAHLSYFDGTALETVDIRPATSFDGFNCCTPWLADGYVAISGTDAEADREIFRFTGTPPGDAAQPPPPMAVLASRGDGDATVSWGGVLGASSYNLYYASEPGVTKVNYSTLADGTRLAGVTSPRTITGLDDAKRYFFVVTTVEGATESASSAEARHVFSQLPTDPLAFRVVAADPTNPLVAYAAGGTKVYRTIDGGNEWTQLAGGIEGQDIRAIAARGSTVLAATRQEDVYRSVNGGTNWTFVLDTDGLVGEQTKVVAIDPSNPNVVYAADIEMPGATEAVSNYVVRSDNGGITWAQLPNHPTKELRAYAIAVDPRRPGTLYAGGSATPLMKSADYGENWIDISPSPGLYVHAIAVDWSNPTRILVGGGAYTGGGALRKTSDGGTVWTDATFGFGSPRPTVYELAFDSAGVLHAGTSAGHYVSTNFGETWTAQNQGLPTEDARYIEGMSLTADGRLLVAAFDGLYRKQVGAGTGFVRGDFNGDGKPDLVWRNYSTGAVNVWFLNGTVYLGGVNLFTVADPNWRIEGTGDFNGDGKSDLVWRNYTTGAVNVWFLDGTAYLGGANLFTVAGSDWKIETVGDFNGDGKDDLIWRNYATGAVNAWFLNGTAYLGGASLFTVADPNWKIEVAGDFNGDGKTDLVWRNYATGAVNVWFLNGTAYLGGANLFTVVDANWRLEAVGDYNGDGKLDLIWRNYASGAVNVWFLNGTAYAGGASLFTVAGASWEIAGPR